MIYVLHVINLSRRFMQEISIYRIGMPPKPPPPLQIFAVMLSMHLLQSSHDIVICCTNQ